jgi:hypothetical protein
MHQQDQQLHSIQDSVLIQHLIAGLIEFGNNVIKDEWYQQQEPAPYITMVGTHIASTHFKNDCDARSSQR